MSRLFALIQRRPVKFVQLIATVLSLAVGFGLSLSPEQVALILGGVNATLAFTLDSFTTAVDVITGEPLNPDYTKVPSDAPDIFFPEG